MFVYKTSKVLQLYSVTDVPADVVFGDDALERFQISDALDVIICFSWIR